MKLSNYCTISSSKEIYACEYTESGIPFYRVKEISEMANGNFDFEKVYISKERFEELKAKYYIPSEKDILITAAGTIGNIYVVQKDDVFYFRDSLLLSNFSKEINPYYIYLYLQFPHVQNYLKNISNYSIQKHITIGMLRNIDINIPSLQKQNEICKIIKTNEDLYKNNLKIIKLLTNKIKDIYSYWFCDFCFPINGNGIFKQNGKFKVEKGILIPENWTFKPLTDNTLCTLIKPGISYFSETKVYLSTSEVNGDKYDLTQNKITYKNRESRANMEPKPNSIWFAKMKNSIKHMAFTEDSDLIKKSILSTGFCGIKCDLNSFSYIWSIIHMPWFETIKDKIASGSTQEAVSEITLSYIDILIPDNETLKKFASFVHPMIKQIYILKRTNDYLASTSKLICKLFISGKLILK